MNNTQLRSWLASSTDPTGQTLATKVKGAILAFSSIIILVVAATFHIQLSANDVITLATELGTIAGVIGVVYGSIQHLIIWWGTKTKTV